jgi:hypothetical protein
MLKAPRVKMLLCDEIGHHELDGVTNDRDLLVKVKYLV